MNSVGHPIKTKWKYRFCPSRVGECFGSIDVTAERFFELHTLHSRPPACTDIFHFQYAFCTAGREGNDEVAADAPHSTRRARTRGPSERARTREGHQTVRARAFRTSPASSTRQVRAALDLVVAKCRAPRPNARFFRPQCALGATPRAPTREPRPARQRVRVRARLPALPALAPIDSRRTRDRGEGQAERFEPAIFPRSFHALFFARAVPTTRP